MLLTDDPLARQCLSTFCTVQSPPPTTPSLVFVHGHHMQSLKEEGDEDPPSRGGSTYRVNFLTEEFL